MCFAKKLDLNNRGQSLIEFAITLPILLILIFAMMGIGFYIYDMSVFTFASNKALDTGIGRVVSAAITPTDIDNIKNDALNYTNAAIFVSKPKIEVNNNVNSSTGESRLTVSIESDYNFKISFVNEIFGSNPKVSSKNSYIYIK
ncbi:Flp pilus assembly protein TadG [Clostridium saccharoperbutylacetonicum]|uniref:TadE-like protein n=1 Tax=Clostridium saccharoperbutylacetonicum N1-4(HMT) TaxID=931276 RepID=M1MC03_9CLOT|nr:TadE/TadG family type IV pilus assembly protein [Clostridium saccharoperbutylacetonicum]AGF55459.1 TadE-like protein [Clostridium saccharoperbutylacetonicum N1-4(HMT)]NRT63826.1 Flp pilus assembly protein TadG [Clostridium saccharoperbutylacetonicum]NSB27189.1 Flp pilus assembly protein TadG [Clostridium saccharoperbutylacetonicum]NSB40676.1 Flp pilus assembly protein TadG [Clostridium saccharoperbutylacetonicum]